MNKEQIRARFKYYRQVILDRDAEIEGLRNDLDNADEDIRHIERQAHQKVYYAQQEAQRARNDAEAAESQARAERRKHDDDERRRRLGLRVY